ncbi:hypothetical protein B9T31_14950 [Acinetobacter sp. ANC 4558]|uniref:hypothetical protein n=1 Tax=Acinetobacter sp. ANC 4558 TaxID=1977876 RepID=UPI000A33B58D|nr:hypothetical protein [Acinetobacter sp. ANC 4558]OTG81820.1 hypothetical protein B9T31_14950 [Acinetobacter sp. ANC 4558]
MNAMVNAEEKQEKLSNLEWLGQQLRAKTANYEAEVPATNNSSINWEDRCGAIAFLPNDESKAYASILVWGDYRDNTKQYAVVVDYIAEYIWRMVQEEMNKKRDTFDMIKFCKHVARMELFYSLRPALREYHTLKGRLVFSGIDYIEPNTYSKRYGWLCDAVALLLKELHDEIEHYVGSYRKQLKD